MQGVSSMRVLMMAAGSCCCVCVQAEMAAPDRTCLKLRSSRQAGMCTCTLACTSACALLALTAAIAAPLPRQFNLFGGTVLKLGTQRHHDLLLRGITSLDDIGCFALTELGYGGWARMLPVALGPRCCACAGAQGSKEAAGMWLAGREAGLEPASQQVNATGPPLRMPLPAARWRCNAAEMQTAAAAACHPHTTPSTSGPILPPAGNNAVEMQTTATFDQASDEFIIHTPTPLGQK